MSASSYMAAILEAMPVDPDVPVGDVVASLCLQFTVESHDMYSYVLKST